MTTENTTNKKCPPRSEFACSSRYHNYIIIYYGDLDTVPLTHSKKEFSKEDYTREEADAEVLVWANDYLSYAHATKRIEIAYQETTFLCQITKGKDNV